MGVEGRWVVYCHEPVGRELRMVLGGGQFVNSRDWPHAAKREYPNIAKLGDGGEVVVVRARFWGVAGWNVSQSAQDMLFWRDGWKRRSRHGDLNSQDSPMISILMCFPLWKLVGSARVVDSGLTITG